MEKGNVIKKAVLTVVFFTVFGAFSSDASASDTKVNWSVSFSSLPFFHHKPVQEVVIYRGKKYHYSDGRFYRPGLLNLTFVAPPIGVIVKAIPPESRVIIIKGDKYYYHNDIYYRSCHDGYIVVSSPKVNTYVESCGVKHPDAVPGEVLTINIPNSNGSYTAINLTKHKDGYIGPQGEFYPQHPTVEQLIALYGK